MRVERTADAEETEALGAEIAEGLKPGDVVLVRGELGTGKTTLIRGACRALGVTEPVTSPTFTIGQRYEGRVPVSHLDLYRLGADGLVHEDPALLADYLTPESIGFVEWPEASTGHLLGLRPAGAPEEGSGRVGRISVEIRHAGGDRREIRIS